MNQRSLIYLLAFIVTIGSVATNIYMPALPVVREYFGSTVAHAQATFSVALLTFAIGMFFWGPFADRYGRRHAILAGVGLMAAGSVVCLLAPSLGWLIAGRGVLAFGTATGIAVSRTIVSDLYPDEHGARARAARDLRGRVERVGAGRSADFSRRGSAGARSSAPRS